MSFWRKLLVCIWYFNLVFIRDRSNSLKSDYLHWFLFKYPFICWYQNSIWAFKIFSVVILSGQFLTRFNVPTKYFGISSIPIWFVPLNIKRVNYISKLRSAHKYDVGVWGSIIFYLGLLTIINFVLLKNIWKTGYKLICTFSCGISISYN